MKYGILTYHNIPNFGAVLQAYALCKKLRSMGADCEIIDYTCQNILLRELSPHQNDSFLKCLAYRIFIWPKEKKKIARCQDFVREYYSKQSYTKENIIEANQMYDCFISGSDMIWNLDVNGRDFAFFLDFAKGDKRRFSYGSSVDGTWPEADLGRIGGYLQDYKGISVRERDTCDTIRECFGLVCRTVCDPTMLIEAETWKSMAAPVKETGYVLVYFPYREILAAAQKYAKLHHKSLVVVDNCYPWKGKDHRILYGPEEWISYIQKADAVFTDSYHGFLFSLYLERPVWTNNKGSRLRDLIERCGLQNCLIENDLDFTNEIDFSQANACLNSLRSQSEEYLQAMLDAGENGV